MLNTHVHIDTLRTFLTFHLWVPKDDPRDNTILHHFTFHVVYFPFALFSVCSASPQGNRARRHLFGVLSLLQVNSLSRGGAHTIADNVLPSTSRILLPHSDACFSFTTGDVASRARSCLVSFHLLFVSRLQSFSYICSRCSLTCRMCLDVGNTPVAWSFRPAVLASLQSASFFLKNYSILVVSCATSSLSVDDVSLIVTLVWLPPGMLFPESNDQPVPLGASVVAPTVSLLTCLSDHAYIFHVPTTIFVFFFHTAAA